MTVKFWKTASSNAFSTTINGSITDSATTITLSSVTGLDTAGGILCIDRQDGSGNNTPSKREFISYTSISGNDLNGVTRGVAGSTNQSHSSGAVVEENFSVTHWNDLNAYLYAEHTTSGTHVLSTPTIASPRLITSVQASGASIVGSFPLYPVWLIPGFASGATTTAGKAMVMPRVGSWSSFWLTTRTPVSGASLTIDIMKNGVSIFNTIGRPVILSPGTFASTASILTKGFVKGDLFTVDIITGGNVADLTVQAEGVL